MVDHGLWMPRMAVRPGVAKGERRNLDRCVWGSQGGEREDGSLGSENGGHELTSGAGGYVPSGRGVRWRGAGPLEKQSMAGLPSECRGQEGRSFSALTPAVTF